MFRQKFHTRTAESIGILVTLQTHNLKKKTIKEKVQCEKKISLRRVEDSHT